MRCNYQFVYDKKKKNAASKFKNKKKVHFSLARSVWYLNKVFLFNPRVSAGGFITSHKATVLLRLWAVVTCVYSKHKGSGSHLLLSFRPKDGRDGFFYFYFLFFLILLLYSSADQFSSSNYYRNGRIRIGNDKRKIPNLLLLLLLYYVISSFSSSLSFRTVSFLFFTRSPARINNRKPRRNCGAYNLGQPKYTDINVR